VIAVELKEAIRDVDPVWAKVRSKVDDAVPDLPADATEPEYEDSSTKASALIVGLTWTLDDDTQLHHPGAFSGRAGGPDSGHPRYGKGGAVWRTR
jgi:multidrug efflux pump subunit AcrB